MYSAMSDGMPAKNDLVIINADDEIHQSFTGYLHGVLDSMEFQKLSYWTDGAILEAAAKSMDVKVTDLSLGHGKEKNPIMSTPFADYVDL